MISNLSKTYEIKLDASGNGTLFLGPQRAGEFWHITNTSIRCTGSVPTNGQPSTWTSSVNGVQMDSSYSVISDNSDTEYTLGPGQTMVCQWTNGPANQVATVAITGTSVM